MCLENIAAFIGVTFAASILCAVIDYYFEQKEFRRWLREGRWKFEKFRH
jgi:peptidoglycan/LPS O-acetylase OafA/YrhL